MRERASQIEGEDRQRVLDVLADIALIIQIDMPHNIAQQCDGSTMLLQPYLEQPVRVECAFSSG
jgi:hypothetical protein